MSLQYKMFRCIEYLQKILKFDMMALGFTRSKVDPNLFFKVEGERPVMLLLYVDDLFMIENRDSLNFQ